MRFAPRTCFWGWPRADWSSLLYQFRFSEIKNFWNNLNLKLQFHWFSLEFNMRFLSYDEHRNHSKFSVIWYLLIKASVASTHPAITYFKIESHPFNTVFLGRSRGFHTVYFFWKRSNHFSNLLYSGPLKVKDAISSAFFFSVQKRDFALKPRQ